MQIIKNYQNEVYSMAFSLTCDAQISEKAAIKAFKSVMSAYHSNSDETKIELYKKLLANIGFFDIRRKNLDKKGKINSVKNKLGLFDRKVFVLKYEFQCSLQNISYIMSSKPDKIKRSLIKSAERMAKALEDCENEM